MQKAVRSRNACFMIITCTLYPTMVIRKWEFGKQFQYFYSMLKIVT